MTMCPATAARGERLIVSLIDSFAKDDPAKVWVSVPVDDEDLSKGFRDVHYAQLSNAINHAAWWLDSTLGRYKHPFEAFAYAGPKDLRYPILTVATVKVGRQIVLPSPFSTTEAQRHIIDLTKCGSYLHAASLAPKIRGILAERPHVRDIMVPDLDDWLREDKAPMYEYTKSFHQAKDDPWIVFHTSGTTGLPRPISYTNYMMTALDAAELMPDAHEETNNSHWAGKRWYTPIPTLHFVGTTFALQMTTFLNTILVIGPVGPPPTAQIVGQILEFGNVAGAELPPSLIEDMCRDDTLLKHLQDLKYLYYVGAPLNTATGDRLAGRCCLNPGIGSTEAGGYFTKVRNDEYWNYYTFRAAMGVRFEHWSNDLYELVFYRDESLKRWQQVFYLYPDLDRFHTKDLWTKHPTREGLWAYAGRTDDLIILSHGESLQAAKIEADITNHRDIRAVVVGGEGRLHPCLIIELAGSADLSRAEQSKVLDRLWPEISKANRLCSEYVKLRKELMMCAGATKPLLRTVKNTILRRESLALYRAEIDALYAHSRLD